MSERGRYHHVDEPDLPLDVAPGIAGGVVSGAPLTTDFGAASTYHPQDAPDGILDVEQDFEAPEGDDGLLNPGSPEFEHLVKPVRRYTS
jgi:hypothetical protein